MTVESPQRTSQRRHCEEHLRRSNPVLLVALDCFASLAMTRGMRPRSRDITCPSFTNSFRPKRKRAQGRPGARCTRGLACQDAHSNNAHEHTGSAETLRPSLRNGFTAYIVLSPVRPGLLVTVTPQKRELLKSLTPTIGASGPHDFAVRFSRARQSQPSRPPLPAPTSVTMANAPSLGTGWQRINK
jgi:hypothetical protein